VKGERRDDHHDHAVPSRRRCRQFDRLLELVKRRARLVLAELCAVGMGAGNATPLDLDAISDESLEAIRA